MNVAVFREAQEAYARGDYKAALEGFTVCARDTSGLAPSDLSKFYHLIGNCYVKSGDSYAAAAFYTKALASSPEKRKPSLYVNLGTALLGTKDYNEALSAFTHALDYPIYTTPYKAYSGIGAAQLKLGNMTEAGAAYREAALDPTNPAPAKALVNLGVCFMELGRTDDAITSYETALEFDLDDATSAKTYANLGQAYMAEGRVQKAIDAFEQACAFPDFELSAMAQHDYDLAVTLKDRLDAKMPGILDTGFIPNVAMIAHDEKPEEPADLQTASEMEPSQSGHLPVYGEPGFDPFAPQTQAMEPVQVAEEGPAEESVDSFEDAGEGGPYELDDEPEEQDAEADEAALQSAKTEMMEPVDVPEDDANQLPATYDEPEYEGYVSAAAAQPVDFEVTDTHMPSPENTEFFDITEQQIAINAKENRRKARRARGVGLKVAIVFVILCILVAGAACAAYVLGYGYPLQEDVADDFFAAVQNDADTSQYWASDVDEATRESQMASLSNLTSYNVEAVQRSMGQSIVYVKGTLAEGGQIDYELVMSRHNISWAIEYVELYFPSQQ